MDYRRPKTDDDEINSIFGFDGPTKLNEPNVGQVDQVSSKNVDAFDTSNSTQFGSTSAPNIDCFKTTDKTTNAVWCDYMIDSTTHVASNILGSLPTMLSSEVAHNETNVSVQVEQNNFPIEVDRNNHRTFASEIGFGIPIPNFVGASASNFENHTGLAENLAHASATYYGGQPRRFCVNHAGLTQNRSRVNASNYRMRQRAIKTSKNLQWQAMELEYVALSKKVELLSNIKDKFKIFLIERGLQSEANRFKNDSK
jgi:hypothetical protein